MGLRTFPDRMLRIKYMSTILLSNSQEIIAIFSSGVYINDDKTNGKGVKTIFYHLYKLIRNGHYTEK